MKICFEIEDAGQGCRRTVRLGDPGDLRTLHDPDDPGDLRTLHDPDDPGDLRTLHDPDDPGDRRTLHDPDDSCAHRSASRRDHRDLRVPEDRGAPTPVKRSYSGFIVVRLSSLLPETTHGDLLSAARQLSLPGLVKVLESFGEPAAPPAVPHASPPAWEAACSPEEGPEQQKRIDTEQGPIPLVELERRARQSALPPIHSLRSYWRLDARGLTVLEGSLGVWNRKEAKRPDGLAHSADEAARLLVEQLNALAEVDLAYREIAVSDPSALEIFAPPAEEELSMFQSYLDPAPRGLDVRWARDQLNGTSSRVKVADLEQGWNLDHEDLEASAPEAVHGDNRPSTPGYRRSHGTAVLSVLAARSSNGPAALGVVGIAAGASEVVTVSHYRLDGASSPDGAAVQTGTNGHVAAAIHALLGGGHLRAGDVLLIEVQRGGLPVELVDPLDFDAIRLAVGNGVIVVEAAGNGGHDLDRWRTHDGWPLDRRRRGFVDSGAIVVGAGRSTTRDRASFSSYGSRLDCFAWGDGVVAAGYGDFLGGEENSLYTDRFPGTSSASAIIAGAAALLQKLYQDQAAADGPDDEGWTRLSPLEMRSLLSDPRTGTRQGSRVAGTIGVMPDLRAILNDVLGVGPRLYLRDHPGDRGERAPSSPQPRTFASPDLVVAGPAATASDFGEGSSTENAVVFPEPAEAATAKIFVRLRNRGLRPSGKVEVDLYRAPISTLVTPDRWRPVVEEGASKITVADVAAGDLLEVGGPLSAPAEKVMDSCLIAVASSGDRPGSKLRPQACTWSKFLEMIRGDGNVAMRNVHRVVVDGSEIERGFGLNGTADADRRFEFRLLQRLPPDVRVQLRLPLALALKFARRRLWKVERDGARSDHAVLRIPGTPRFVLGRVTLPAAVAFPGTVRWSGAGRLRSGHSFAIQQLYQGEEVGRITWEF